MRWTTKSFFDGSALKHSVGDQTVSYTPATQAQIEKYKAMADEWHGGAEQHVVDLSKMGSTYVARDGDVLTGKISNDKTVILVAPDATITLRNARIEYTKEGFDTHWAGLECEGNATIILEDSNYVRGADFGCPGIYPEKALTIKGIGSLEAVGSFFAPGIGSGSLGSGFQYGGTVNIEGGTIIARGGAGAPGIGTYDNELDKIIIRASACSVKAVKGVDALESIGIGKKEGKVGTIYIEGGSKVVRE